MEKGKLWMMIIIVILALMCAGFVIGFLVLTNTIQSLQTETGSTPTETTAVSITQADIIDIPIGEDITSNLKRGEDGRDDHLVLLKMEIGLNSKDPKYEDMSPVITSKTFGIKDIVTGILRSKTYEDLNMDGANSLLKDEILTKLQDYFQTNVIVQVNLTFILQ